MENFKRFEIEFEDEEANNLVCDLRDIFTHTQNNFAEMCFTITRIWMYFDLKPKQAKDDLYYTAYTLLDKFGFDRKAVSRYKNCYTKFCEGNDLKNVRLKSYFEFFSSSKLFELLPLSDETLNNVLFKGLIKPSMTVKEIRGIVKDLINGVTLDKVTEVKLEEEINEAEIPMVYDPAKEYDFDYFKSKCKNQLVNMIWELQKAFQKLKNKRK